MSERRKSAGDPERSRTEVPETWPAAIRGQTQTFLRLWRAQQPHVRTDPLLPGRLQAALRQRSFGARDRRLYRELTYTAIRHLPWIEELDARHEAAVVRAVAWLAADTPATRRYREAVVAGWPPVPPGMAERARHLGVAAGLLPDWFRAHCPEAFASPNLEVLHTRAPLWIRMQTDRVPDVLTEWAEHGWACRQSDVWPPAWTVLADADLTGTAAYRDGRIEIQDLGSQLVLGSVGVGPGGRWLDACAGAGGKTLQLARMLGAHGHVDAHDVRPAALAELRRRAQRGGFTNIGIVESVPTDATYDGVLVDAPCSGSGTWRRAPHLKWCTTPDDVISQAARQRSMLIRFSAHVRPGGQLVYATCSLSRRENQEVVAAFLAGRSDFTVEPPVQAFRGTVGELGLTLLPAQHDSDGFFVATLRRP